VGIIGAVARTTQQEPALVPVLLGALALGLWSFRNRRWARIADMDNRALRVILLEDGETIHNAFFDRDFKE